MIKKSLKRIHRLDRHKKVRAQISGTTTLPRVAIFRSNNHVYGQVIDDSVGRTILAVSDKSLKPKTRPKEAKLGAKESSAFIAGQTLGTKMKEKKIIQAIFDRGGFRYHGRVKAFVEGLRDKGIKI
ncbi:MAG: 50S ribosomal protein L18 [Candidatus Yanofskybacteria bacterium CG10_big_fil_rev_8_21_14_0_10_46_23]|uniref:Large ribosomal subunit protein uL18 n=1 Tax=Candidatus Yanofskybacteria bacterium CG10_big_fil_rev_8_21_14_0_10_46_23 TaxID=1975098 RepID=A0A2H0R3V7_9BACT|nr:MAG: 50S ribosomal protein L18 [Candidatus Yanofskybacteria bacterium CG10_big_fil_rev_8_21_14_0_10_46_23]